VARTVDRRSFGEAMAVGVPAAPRVRRVNRRSEGPRDASPVGPRAGGLVGSRTAIAPIDRFDGRRVRAGTVVTIAGSNPPGTLTNVDGAG
jgi:hypothetical protein